jgi:uncharacterized repeat protein (TIGR03843 family)
MIVMMDEVNDVLEILNHGNIDLKGEFLWGSNYTFLVQLTHRGSALPVVYKPIKGERPLWDFPPASLAHREVAAFLVNEMLGWDMVPATVYRMDGPLGPGSMQLFVDHDPEYHYFNFSEQDRQRMRPVILFDLLINNADRKGSHILIGSDKRIWLIDHGLCFHEEYKLRTVLWDFVGDSIPAELCDDLERFRLQLDPQGNSLSKQASNLNEHLSVGEIRSLAQRAVDLIAIGHFPAPDPRRRNFPWPQL